MAQLVKNLPAMRETSGRKESNRTERLSLYHRKGLPCGSAGKESTCNAGHLGSIPGSGKSLPVYLFWASLTVRMAKNLLTAGLVDIVELSKKCVIAEIDEIVKLLELGAELSQSDAERILSLVFLLGTEKKSIISIHHPNAPIEIRSKG